MMDWKDVIICSTADFFSIYFSYKVYFMMFVLISHENGFKYELSGGNILGIYKIRQHTSIVYMTYE